MCGTVANSIIAPKEEILISRTGCRSPRCSSTAWSTSGTILGSVRCSNARRTASGTICPIIPSVVAKAASITFATLRRLLICLGKRFVQSLPLERGRGELVNVLQWLGAERKIGIKPISTHAAAARLRTRMLRLRPAIELPSRKEGASRTMEHLRIVSPCICNDAVVASAPQSGSSARRPIGRPADRLPRTEPSSHRRVRKNTSVLSPLLIQRAVTVVRTLRHSPAQALAGAMCRQR